MKLKNFALTLAIVIIGTTVACAQQRIFADIPAGKGVQKVYVAPALMKMLGSKAFDSVNSSSTVNKTLISKLSAPSAKLSSNLSTFRYSSRTRKTANKEP